MSTYLADFNTPPKTYDNCPPFLEQYMRYLEINKGLRPLTLNDTAINLREFCQYIHILRTQEYPPETMQNCKQSNIVTMQLSEIASVTPEELNNYIWFLCDAASLSSATAKKKISFIRKMYDYLILMREELDIFLPNGNPAKDILIPESEPIQAPSPLSAQQLHQLAISAKSSSLRDRIILMLFVTTGITLAEMVSLNMGDLVTLEWLKIRDYRRTTYRYVYLPLNCQNVMKEYLTDFKSRNGDYNDKTPLLCAKKQKRITTRTIRSTINRLGLIAGIDESVTPRLLRESVYEILSEYHGNAYGSMIPEYFGYSLYHRYGSMEPSLTRHKKISNTTRDMIISSPLNDIGSEYTEEANLTTEQDEIISAEGKEHEDGT